MAVGSYTLQPAAFVAFTAFAAVFGSSGAGPPPSHRCCWACRSFVRLQRGPLVACSVAAYLVTRTVFNYVAITATGPSILLII